MTAADEALSQAVLLLREAPVFTGYPEWVARRDAFLAAHGSNEPVADSRADLTD